MEENVIQINGRIMINIDMSIKNVMHVKKIMFGILLHVVMKMENTQMRQKKKNSSKQILIKRKPSVKRKITVLLAFF